MVSKFAFFFFSFGYFFVFTEEITFKYFLFINITKFRFFLICSEEADMKSLNSFKDYDVHIINFFRLIHTLKRSLTKLVYVQKEKKLKLKSSYLLYFMEKSLEI